MKQSNSYPKRSRHKEKDRAAHKTLLPSMAAKIGGLGGSRMRTIQNYEKLDKA